MVHNAPQAQGHREARRTNGRRRSPRRGQQPGLITNAQIADLLRRYAAVLALERADRFKLKAYRRAAETIESLSENVADLVAQDQDLTDLPGIGRAINDIILETVRTGKLSRLEQKTAELPASMLELADKPALDPKRISQVYKKLGINSLAELKKKLEAGEVRKVLGPRIDYHVRHGLDERPRRLLWNVQDIAARMERNLRAMNGVVQASCTGSLRRRQDTVGDLNFLVAASNPASIFRRFAGFSGVLSAEPRSPDERAFRLSSGDIVALRITRPETWGLAQIESTGSTAHVADLQKRAARRGMRLGDRSSGDERSVYTSLGLSYIEPELREGRGEVASAARGRLPQLVTVADLRGDLHMHTIASDGANTIADMAAAAQARGYEYIAITDHSQSLKITNGLTEGRLLKHIDAIDKANGRLRGFRILKSAEVDILEDGRLDYSQSILKKLDLTICSIHSRFGLDREKQTERILRAMDNRYFTILGHATGRLLLKRPGYEVDMERIVEHAHENGCFFEINSSPDRLDLSDEHAKLAKDAGVKIAINTDAHSTRELDFISAGINQARRGWLEAADVLNALPVDELLTQCRR
jgi:DNA polymerase (family X)